MRRPTSVQSTVGSFPRASGYNTDAGEERQGCRRLPDFGMQASGACTASEISKQRSRGRVHKSHCKLGTDRFRTPILMYVQRACPGGERTIVRRRAASSLGCGLRPISSPGDLQSSELYACMRTSRCMQARDCVSSRRLGPLKVLCRLQTGWYKSELCSSWKD